MDQLYAAAAGRPIDALLANAGHGLGKAFPDQETSAWTHVIDTSRASASRQMAAPGSAHKV